MSVFRRRLVFEGRHPFIGVLLPDDGASRALILSWWQPGTVVQSCVAGLVVRFAAPRTFDADEMRGVGLVEAKGVLVGAPLAKAQLDALAPPQGNLVIASAGRLECLPLAVTALDPSEWLEVPPATVITVTRPTLPVAPMAVALAPRPVQLRPDPKALAPEASRALTEALQPATGVPRQSFFRRTATSVLRWWRDRRGGNRALPPSTTQRGPGPMERLERWANRQLDDTRLGRWMDDVNRTYVDRLLRMFEQEALDDALKHAVPLSRKTAEPGALPSHTPYGARQTVALNLGPRTAATGPAPVMQATVYEALKKRYRAAAEKLEQAGRIDEAAFVLADLLDAPQEAVDLLERHDQYEKAARLAESRSLAPELTVRLWLLARDVDRAIAVARRYRAFASALARLERVAPRPDPRDQMHAEVLRLHWAQSLAASGDFGGAAAAVRDVERGRALMLTWVDLGIEAGGPQRGPLLVRRLELEPSTSQAQVELAHQLLNDTAEATAPERAALAEAVVSSTDSASLEQRRPLARAAIRALVRDESTWGVLKPGLIGKLIAFDDGPLRADLPSYAPGVRSGEAVPPRFERDPTALTPHDAVLLPNGALLVALGESGVALVAHDGRVTWRADVPAFSLVMSDEGTNVLALAPREDVTSVSRISMAPRRATRWADVQLTCWSDTFRDGIWFIAAGPRVLGLDVLGERPVPLWELPALPVGAVSALATSSSSVAVLMTIGADVVRRAWRFPRFDLIENAGVFQAGDVERSATTSEREFVLLGRAATGSLTAWTPAAAANQPPTAQSLPGVLAGTPSMHGTTFAVPTQWRQERPDQLDVLLRPGQRSFGFGHATRAHTRFQRNVLVICCDNGHVVCFDTNTQRLLRDVTVKP
ncbi:MAG: bpX6 domain-containing protein [Myxococcales bacterium]|nr:bpX6 domain-containing protein [Myxococcales bacterium]